ncbi:hypothetical protein FKM82_024587 [Ascaphus truei]
MLHTLFCMLHVHTMRTTCTHCALHVDTTGACTHYSVWYTYTLEARTHYSARYTLQLCTHYRRVHTPLCAPSLATLHLERLVLYFLMYVLLSQ